MREYPGWSLTEIKNLSPRERAFWGDLGIWTRLQQKG